MRTSKAPDPATAAARRLKITPHRHKVTQEAAASSRFARATKVKQGLWPVVALLLSLLPAAPALAQAPGGPPPSVGVVTVQSAMVTETSEFVGRVQAVDRVTLTARVTAFLDKRLFTEGADVKAGDLMFQLEKAPFEADLSRQEASVADWTARLNNATTHLDRAQSLLQTPAGQRSAVEDAQMAQRSAAAQMAQAQAGLRQSRINIGYTEIRAPIAGQVGRSLVTPGNVVSPTSGTLATIVSQDPMYVTFPVAVRVLTELRARYAGKGGLDAVRVRLKLPDGSSYDQVGKINYIDTTVSPGTDTLLARAIIANPPLGANPPMGAAPPGRPIQRALIDGAFVAVSVEGVKPVSELGIPRAAVLSDQSGNFVYVVGADNKVERRSIRLGQSTPVLAVISDGLKLGESVILEGVQRARPGIQVTPAPAAPAPGMPSSAMPPPATAASGPTTPTPPLSTAASGAETTAKPAAEGARP